MATAEASLQWGWSGYGLQPVSFSDANGSYTFAPGYLWLVEFAPSGLTSREVKDPGDVTPVVTQTSDVSWSVAWSVDGLDVVIGVEMTGRRVEFSIEAASNTSGKRWRSIYGPLLRIQSAKSTSEDVYTRREERSVLNFWTTSLVNDPVTTLANVPGIDAEDENFIPGFEDVNLPGFSGLIIEGPGTNMLEFGGFYDRSSRSFLSWQTTDVAGRPKKWIQASDGASMLFGWQHWIPGETGNTFSLDYAVRLEIGSTSVAGRQWHDIAAGYRSWLDSLAPPPRWYVPAGWGDKRAREAAFVVVQNHVPPISSVADTTAAAAASAGSHQIEITAGAPTAGEWLGVDVSPQSYFHEIIRVDGTTLTLRKPLVADVAAGQTLRFYGDPNVASTEAALAKVRSNFVNACDYVGVPTSRAVLVDYFAFCRFDNVGGYPDTHGHNGWPSDIEAHNAALRAMGAAHLCYWLMHAFALESTAEQVYGAASTYPQYRDDGETPRRDTSVPVTGPVQDVDLQVPFVVSEATRKLAEFVTLRGFSGLYWDAFVGAPGDRHRSWHAGLDSDEKGDGAKSLAEWLGAIDAAREAVSGSGAGSWTTGGGESVFTDGAGNDLTPGAVPWGLTSDGAEVSAVAEVYLETSPGQLACTGPDVLVATSWLPVHSGAALSDSGSPLGHILDDGTGVALMDGENELDTGHPIVLTGGLMASENPVAHSLDRWDLSPHKAAFPLDFGLIPLPCAFGVAIGGRSQFFNLTDHYPNFRNRSGSVDDMPAGSAGVSMTLAYLEWLMGSIASVILFNESDTMDVGAMDPPGGLLTFEGRLSAWHAELASWDLVDKVRRYRREGGAYRWSEYGKGRTVEAWERQDATLLDLTNAVVAVDAFESAEGLLLAVGNMTYTDDLGRDVVAEIDGDELTLPGSTVVELSKDGTETEVAGVVSGGSLSMTLTVPARGLRIFEVRA